MFQINRLRVRAFEVQSVVRFQQQLQALIASSPEYSDVNDDVINDNMMYVAVSVNY